MGGRAVGGAAVGGVALSGVGGDRQRWQIQKNTCHATPLHMKGLCSQFFTKFVFLMTRLSIQRLALLPALLLALGAGLPAQAQTPTSERFSFSHRNPCKVFIGVGTSAVSEGLKVDYTVDNTPATTYGVQAGDVILTLDGVAVRSQSELIRERDKHQQGEAFTLSILREGSPMTIQARFKACSAEELDAAQQKKEERWAEKEVRMAEMKARIEARVQEKMKGMEQGERPILGIYEDNEVNEPGIAIGSVIPDKGAASAGLQAGDVVVKVDGKTVTGGISLRTALVGHKPGEQVKVVYLRDGKTIETDLTLSADRYSYTYKTERDPCKVFIGVYTSSRALDGRGSRVTGVIDGTPAKQSGIQPGDIIMALNGQPVNDYGELTRERDKNKPGDAFRLSVLRDGVEMEIEARFKSCDTPGNAPVPETVETVVVEEAAKTEQREEPKILDNSLIMSVLEAYPSPTVGPLNIHFEAEAVPTVVLILDVAGKAVYSQELPQFSGSFTEQVNLSGNKPGNYVLSIRQGNQVRSKQIVLMPRA